MILYRMINHSTATSAILLIIHNEEKSFYFRSGEHHDHNNIIIPDLPYIVSYDGGGTLGCTLIL